jgi:hypothetical protein
VIAATSPYKLAVNLCYQDGTCQGGTTAAPAVAIPTDRWGGQIPADNSTAKKYVNTVALSAAGVITATAVSGEGLSGATYILTPTVDLDEDRRLLEQPYCMTKAPEGALSFVVGLLGFEPSTFGLRVRCSTH